YVLARGRGDGRSPARGGASRSRVPRRGAVPEGVRRLGEALRARGRRASRSGQGESALCASVPQWNPKRTRRGNALKTLASSVVAEPVSATLSHPNLVPTRARTRRVVGRPVRTRQRARRGIATLHASARRGPRGARRLARTRRNARKALAG